MSFQKRLGKSGGLVDLKDIGNTVQVASAGPSEGWSRASQNANRRTASPGDSCVGTYGGVYSTVNVTSDSSPAWSTTLNECAPCIDSGTGMDSANVPETSAFAPFRNHNLFVVIEELEAAAGGKARARNVDSDADLPHGRIIDPEGSTLNTAPFAEPELVTGPDAATVCEPAAELGATKVALQPP